MRSALNNLFNLAPQQIVSEVYVMLGLIWLMVLVGALWSIMTTERTALAKGVWSAITILVPGVGVLVYAFWCFSKLDILLLKSRNPSSSKTTPRRQAQPQKQDGDYADAVL